MPIPVQFVPEGKTAEEARRLAKQRTGLLPEQKRQLAILFIGFSTVVSIGVLAWFNWATITAYFDDSAPAEIVATTPAAPETPLEPAQRPTPTTVIPPEEAPIIVEPAPVTAITPTNIFAGHVLSKPIRTVLDLSATSPLDTPPALMAQTTPYTTLAKLLISHTHTTPALTPTLSLSNTLALSVTAQITHTVVDTRTYIGSYELLANDVFPENDKIYYYVSGWIVEQDGLTPRPQAVQLHYPTGVLHYPRPNNTDVATGYYEFLVEPGQYTLQTGDFSLPLVISPGQPSRYEVSIRYTLSDTLASAARSSPWVEPQASRPASPQPHTPTPTPPPPLPSSPDPAKHTLYLPFISHQPAPLQQNTADITGTAFLPKLPPETEPPLAQFTLYLPMVRK